MSSLTENKQSPEVQPLWYKDAVIYQLHVKSFYDSNCDGIGDFKGLTHKLDYLRSLGITAIWILPFYPSPLKDDGYDIANYYDVNPQYGTLNDFLEFLNQAHERDMRVITELVINHTSDQHPWFQRARKSEKGSEFRDYYVWSETTEKYRDARIIFKDFEGSNWTWDPVAKAHYWHRFYSHQPDLNFDNPLVQEEIFKIADFWFELGVDGVRLDAVPYLFEREGTNCENLPETYEFLKKLRAHVDSNFSNRMLLAEANQWPEDAIKYFGDGDECHMAFHFPLMPRMYMALQMEDRFPIVDILENTPSIPDNCQWAVFLRNHDELTLEMVTDEERDYMYRIYTKDPRAKINLGIRRRLVPLLNNDRKKIELMNILLFSLLGTPVIYYGDEIGMGDNYYLGDRNGVRTPMQWSSDRNAGFSRANPQQLYFPVIIDPEYHYESVNVETQDKNLSSLLWWMRRVINIRKKFKVFSRGTVEFLLPDNPKILSFIRRYEREVLVAVINLSRFSQYVELNLSEFKGFTPKEVFSQNEFPTVRKSRYGLTLGPHQHFWLQLVKKRKFATVRDDHKLPEIQVEREWQEIFEGKAKVTLEEQVIPVYLKRCRWFGDKSKTIKGVEVSDHVRLSDKHKENLLAIVQVQYAEGGGNSYVMPISYASQGAEGEILKEHPDSVIARLHIEGNKGIIYDDVYSEGFRQDLLSTILSNQSVTVDSTAIKGISSEHKEQTTDMTNLQLPSVVLKAEQSNTSLIYGDQLFLKLYRRMETGINSDAEIVRYLTEIQNFRNVPPYAGVIEYKKSGQEPSSLCMLQKLVVNEGDAWVFTIDHLKSFYDRVLAKQDDLNEPPSAPLSLMGTDEGNYSREIEEFLGGHYAEMIKLLGKRTAEMHMALGAPTEDPNFMPEDFSTLYQRSLFQSMSAMTRKVCDDLHKKMPKLQDDLRKEVKLIVDAEKDIIVRFKGINQKKLDTKKIRTHGDYHLGQVLFTGKDFMIIDFEGEPAKPLSERRLKKSPLRDVAGMIRSFHYAAYGTLLRNPNLHQDNIPLLEPWANLWYHYISGVFLSSYIDGLSDWALIPKEEQDVVKLLQIFVLEKAIYELNYELNNRPNWLIIPARGIRQILNIPYAGEERNLTQLNIGGTSQ